MQNDLKEKRELLSIGDASEYLGVSIDTLRRWAKKGKIDLARSPGGHRYFEKKSLDSLFGSKYERTVKTEYSKKLPEDKIDEVIITETKKIELILDRPPREIKIPESTPVKIMRSQTMDPQIAYMRQQTVSVLLPTSANPINQTNEKPLNSTQIHQNIKNDNKILSVVVIVILLFAGLVLIMVASSLIRTSAPQILSPLQ